MILFNASRCVGCYACQVACKVEKDLPVGPRLVTVFQSEYTEAGKTPRIYYRVSRCLHCADSPCVRICPVKAIRYEEKGVILIESKKCIGCRLCLVMCPYCVPDFNSRQEMTKCNLCIERLWVGLEPTCVTACPVGALELVEPAVVIGRRRKEIVERWK